MVTPRKSRSSFAIVPSVPPDKNVDESVRSSAAFADTSVFTCPEVSDGDKLLARCSQKTIMPFAELLPEETLLACKKVGLLFDVPSERGLMRCNISDWRGIVRRSIHAPAFPLQ